MVELSALDGHCLVCSSGLFAGVVFCTRCATAHHRDCWDYAGSCALFGCGETRCGATPDAPPLELPVQRAVSLSGLVAQRAAQLGQGGDARSSLPPFHGARDLATLCGRTVEVLLEVLGADRGLVFMRRQRLEMRAHARLADQVCEHLDAPAPDVARGCAHEAFLTGKTVHHQDLRQALERPGPSTRLMEFPLIRSVLAMPIGLSAAPDGVLYVETKLTSKVLTQADVEFAHGLATLFSLELQFMSAA